MLRLASRTLRVASVGLLGLLVAAPPLARADDDDGKRWPGQVTRPHPSARDDDRGKRNGRESRREVRREGGDRGRREQVQPQRVQRERRQQRVRVERTAPPPRALHRDRHEHRDRREWRDRSEHRDRSEWRGDRREWRADHREWRDDRREWKDRKGKDRHEWRGHPWNHARYAVHHDRRWHWHGDRWCPPGHRHPPGRRVGWSRHHHDDWRWARYRRPPVVHSQYYCAPCSGWYADRYAFDRHVYGHHRLPQLSFGDAVAQTVWGLVYFGL